MYFSGWIMDTDRNGGGVELVIISLDLFQNERK